MINKKKSKVNDWLTSFLFVLPVVLGILLFTAVPMGSSLVYSFCEYNIVDPNSIKPIGFGNFIRAFTEDWRNVGNSLLSTLLYTVISMPLSLVLSYSLALLLTKEIPGIKVFRTLIYLPVLIPAVVGGLLWLDILDYERGAINLIITSLGGTKLTFYSQEKTALATFIGTGLCSLGGSMVLWIAQIKNVPDSMLESASIEGAGYGTKLFKIILPMCSPMIFYNLVLGVIGSLQVFASAMMVSSQSTGGALNFLSLYIYNTLFTRWDMGYACALSWLLFVLIGLLTVLIFKTSKWVFYGEED